MIHALKIAGYIVGGTAALIGIVLVVCIIGLIRQWNKPNGFNG